MNSFENRNVKRAVVVSLDQKAPEQTKRKEDERPDDDLSERYSVDELLVGAEETEMDLETAVEILTDPETDLELKERANELLGESDHTGVDSELQESGLTDA